MSNAKTVRLESGSHSPGDGKGCVMEVVSMLAGEPFTDTPECACPVLTQFAIRTNDWMNDDERQQLWPFTTRLVNSRADEQTTKARAYRMADWAVREIAPLRFEVVGKQAEADALRALAPITDKATAVAGLDHCRALRKAADAYAAAHAAAYAYAYADAYAAAHAAAAAAAVAAAVANAAANAAAVARQQFVAMRLALLDELCPPAPLPDDALTCDIAERLEEQMAA